MCSQMPAVFYHSVKHGLRLLYLLNKAYILPHLEYCSTILFGINKLLKTKLEAANHYALKSLASRSRISTEYEVLLKAASMGSLEQRGLEQSLAVLFKSLKLISDVFNHRATRYNLRATENKLQQSTYNTLYKHNSLAYITSHHITSHHITSHHITSHRITSVEYSAS